MPTQRVHRILAPCSNDKLVTRRSMEGKEGRKPMNRPSRETIVRHLSEQVCNELEDHCLSIVREVTRGKSMKRTDRVQLRTE